MCGAAMCGAAMCQYTEFVFMSATDKNGHTADIPMWRVHMGSASLGALGFVIALFCLEALNRSSKTLALRSAISWFPLVALTGFATIIHIPVFIVILAGSVYGVWMYRRTRAVHSGN